MASAGAGKGGMGSRTNSMEHLNAGAAPSTKWVPISQLPQWPLVGFFVCVCGGGIVTECLKTVSQRYGSLANQLLERSSKGGPHCTIASEV